MATPAEIRLRRAERCLDVTYDDGARFSLEAEYLRVESPSAEVQGHAPSERKIIGGKREVAIRGVEPVGNYAIRILFDDGHDTGIYTWDYLHELGRDHARKWRDYLTALERLGLRREP